MGRDRLAQLAGGGLAWEPGDACGREGRPVPVIAPSRPRQALSVLLLALDSGPMAIAEASLEPACLSGGRSTRGALPAGLPASKEFVSPEP